LAPSPLLKDKENPSAAAASSALLEEPVAFNFSLIFSALYSWCGGPLLSQRVQVTVRPLVSPHSIVQRQSRTTPPKHNLEAGAAAGAKVGTTPRDILAAGRAADWSLAGNNGITNRFEFLTPSIPIRLSSMSLSLNICHLYLALYFLEELPALLFLPPFLFHMIWWRARGSFIGVEYEANVNWRGWTSILPL
jgi:hypothetical protein